MDHNILDRDFGPNSALDDHALKKAFIGKNQDYYIDAWTKIKNGDAFSFHWPAFFLVVFWLCYRKMYLEGAILILIIFIETYISDMLIAKFGAHVFIHYGIQIAYSIAAAILANKIYLNSTKRKIAKIKALTTDKEERLALAIKAGGTSWVSAIFGGILIMFILSLPELIHIMGMYSF